MRQRWWKGSGRFMLVFGAIMGGFFPAIGMAAGTADAAQVRLEVLDPRGEISTPPPVPLSARLNSLAGRKVAILNNAKEGARAFQPYLEKLLKEAEPTVLLRSWNVPYNDYPEKGKDLEEIAAWSDAVVGLMGD